MLFARCDGLNLLYSQLCWILPRHDCTDFAAALHCVGTVMSCEIPSSAIALHHTPLTLTSYDIQQTLITRPGKSLNSPCEGSRTTSQSQDGATLPSPPVRQRSPHSLHLHPSRCKHRASYGLKKSAACLQLLGSRRATTAGLGLQGVHPLCVRSIRIIGSCWAHILAPTIYAEVTSFSLSGLATTRLIPKLCWFGNYQDNQ